MSQEKPLIFTIFQLTHAIKLCLEATFPMVWVQGEISNFKEQTSGHLYFSLKDSQAQIAAVMFRGDAVSLRKHPKVGDHVIARGELNIYPPKGNYQLIIREMSQVGLGELLLKLEQLKIKLHQKGWFSSERKKALPRLPRRIGIVTSPTGAAIQDILHILRRRFSGVHVIINPVRVQGEGAAKEIAQAIEQFNRYDLVDVMIIGRGGGSVEDLWAFNEEIVAKAIFHSKIPIISAVGHETDHCIADYVADVRAPTPSAAAEIVISEKAHHLQHLDHLKRRLSQTLAHLITNYRHRLQGLTRQPLLYKPYAFLAVWLQKIDDLRLELDTAIDQLLQKRYTEVESYEKRLKILKPLTQIQNLRQRFFYLQKTLLPALERRLSSLHKEMTKKREELTKAWSLRMENCHQLFSDDLKRKQLNNLMLRQMQTSKDRFEAVKTNLSSLDPKNILKKGYSIVFAEKENWVINSVHDLRRQQKIRIVTMDGEATASVAWH